MPQLKDMHHHVFGYRSLVFRLVASLLACLVMSLFFGIIGFVFAFIMSIYLNLNALDTMKITLDDELLQVTRYVPLTRYDCKFWLRDIKEAGIYLKVKAGKAIYPDGGRSGTVQSWYVLHIILKDGSEQEVMLLGMLAFERNKLTQAIKEKDIPSFEIMYRLKQDGTLYP